MILLVYIISFVIFVSAPAGALQVLPAQPLDEASAAVWNRTKRASAVLLAESSANAGRNSPTLRRGGGRGSASAKAAGKQDAIGSIERRIAGIGGETWYIPCGELVHVHKDTDLKQQCSQECPLFAPVEGAFCAFRCVHQNSCLTASPSRPVPDIELGMCRRPAILYCAEHNWDGADTCKVCQWMYSVHRDGRCYFEYWWVLRLCLGVLVAGVMFVLYWYLDLYFRPVTNPNGLVAGLTNRSLRKLHMPKELGSSRRLWSLSTNLTNEDRVAGPGMTLHFNFQVAVMIWAALVAMVWLSFALWWDTDLLLLGQMDMDTEYERCFVSTWGHFRQQELMPAKVAFLMTIYAGSFLCCVFFSIQQRNKFQDMLYRHTSMKDFVAVCNDLPPLSGHELVEDELRLRIAQATGIEPVGVSIAWEFHAHVEEIRTALEWEFVHERRSQVEAQASLRQREPPHMWPARSWFHQREKNAFTKLFGSVEELPPRQDQAELVGLLKELQCSSQAFVVFDTVFSRRRAVELLRERGGVEFRGQTLQLKLERPQEPDTVLWENWGRYTTMESFMKIVRGIGTILLALLGWMVFCYIPYALLLWRHDYQGGLETPFGYSIVFVVVIMLGNQIMYYVCGIVADSVGWHFIGQREATYMVLYCLACTLQCLLDMVVEFHVAVEVAQGLGFRNWNGDRIEDVATFSEKFELYPVQRRLAEHVWAYCWPTTFLAPYIFEPMTIWAPFQIGHLIVGSHPEFTRRVCELGLEAIPMDMGRYADIVLNVMLSSMIFFFPSAYTLRLFVLLVISHVWIYCYDHYKVLRCIPKVFYSSDWMDGAAQVMLGLCNALLASILCFKCNCQPWPGYCLSGWRLIAVCTSAFVLHLAVHLATIYWVVPHFVRKPRARLEPTFAKVCSMTPSSWFTANPVHCLRSKLVYEHQPPCTYYFPGKEHFLERNNDIGCYFEDEVGEFEAKETFALNLAGEWKKAKSSARDILHRVAERVGTAQRPETLAPVPSDGSEEREEEGSDLPRPSKSEPAVLPSAKQRAPTAPRSAASGPAVAGRRAASRAQIAQRGGSSAQRAAAQRPPPGGSCFAGLRRSGDGQRCTLQ